MDSSAQHQPLSGFQAFPISITTAEGDGNANSYGANAHSGTHNSHNDNGSSFLSPTSGGGMPRGRRQSGSGSATLVPPNGSLSNNVNRRQTAFGGASDRLGESSYRSGGPPPPNNRRATQMMGASMLGGAGSPRGGANRSGSFMPGASTREGDDGSDDEDGSKRRRRAQESNQLTHAEASSAAFDQYNQQSLKQGGQLSGAGIGGTSISAGIGNPSAASLRKKKMDDAAKDLAAGEVESEGSDESDAASSSSDEPLDFFVNHDSDGDDDDDDGDDGGVVEYTEGHNFFENEDGEEIDEEEAIANYLKSLEAERKATVRRIRQVQEELRYRDFNSLNTRYKLAGMIDPAVLGETEISPNWMFAGRIYAVFISAFALLHVVAAVIATVKGNGTESFGDGLFIVTTVVSAFDFIFRVITISPRASLLALLYDLIVLLASFFKIIGVLPKYAVYFAMLRSVRAFRAILLFEAYETCRDMFLVQQAIMASFSPLMVVCAIFLIGLMVFSTIVWAVEQSGFNVQRQLRLQPCTSNSDCSDRLSPLQSIPHGMWLVVSCMSTVGLGDVIPNSTVSRALICVAMVFGVFMIAFPSMILVGNLQTVRRSYFAMLERRAARLQVLAVMFLAKKEQIEALKRQKALLLERNNINVNGEEDEEEGNDEEGAAAGGEEDDNNKNMGAGGADTHALMPIGSGSHNRNNNDENGAAKKNPFLSPSGASATAGAGAGGVMFLAGAGGEKEGGEGGGHAKPVAGNKKGSGFALPSPPPARNNFGGGGVNPFSKPSDHGMGRGGAVGFADDDASSPLATAALIIPKPPSANGSGNTTGNNTPRLMSPNHNGNASNSTPLRGKSPNLIPAAGLNSGLGSANSFHHVNKNSSPNRGLLHSGGGGAEGGSSGSSDHNNNSGTLGPLERRTKSNASHHGGQHAAGGNGGSMKRTPSQNFGSGIHRVPSNAGGGAQRVPSNAGGLHRVPSNLAAAGGLQRVPSSLRRAPSNLQLAVMDQMREDNKGEMKNAAMLNLTNALNFGSPNNASGGAGMGHGFASMNSFYGRGGVGVGSAHGSFYGGAGGAGGASSVVQAAELAATVVAQQQGTFEDPLQPEPMDVGTGIMYCGEALLVESQRDSLSALKGVCTAGGGFGLQPGIASMPFLPTKASGSAAVGNPGVALSEDMLLYYSPICKLLTTVVTAAAGKKDSAAAAAAAASASLPLVSNIVILGNDAALFQLTLIVDDNFARTIATDAITDSLKRNEQNSAFGATINADGTPSTAFGDVIARSLPMKGLEVSVVSGLPNNIALLRRSDSAEVTGNQLPLVFLVKNVSKYGVPTDDELDRMAAAEDAREDDDKAVEESLNRSTRDSRQPQIDPTAVASAIAKDILQLQLRLLFRHSEKAACSWRQTSHVNRTLLSNADIIRELRAIAVNVSPSLYWPKDVQKTVAKSVRDKRQNVAFVKPEHVPMFVDRMLSSLVAGQLREHSKQFADDDDDDSTIIIVNRTELQAQIGSLFAYHCRELYKSEIPSVIHSAIFAERLVEETDVLLEVNIDFLRHGVWPLGTIGVEYAFTAPVCERMTLVNAKSAPGVVAPAVPIMPVVGNRSVFQRVKTFVDEDNFEASMRHATGEDMNDLFDNIYEQNKAHAQIIMKQMGITATTTTNIHQYQSDQMAQFLQQQAQEAAENANANHAGDENEEAHRSTTALNPDGSRTITIPKRKINFHPDIEVNGGGSEKKNNISLGFDIYDNNYSTPSNSTKPLLAAASFPANDNGTAIVTIDPYVMEEDEATARKRRQEYHRKLMQSVNLAATGKMAIPMHLIDGGNVVREGDTTVNAAGDDTATIRRQLEKKDGKVTFVGHIPTEPARIAKGSEYDPSVFDSTNKHNLSRNSGGRAVGTSSGGGSSNLSAAEALYRLQHSLGFHGTRDGTGNAIGNAESMFNADGSVATALVPGSPQSEPLSPQTPTTPGAVGGLTGSNADPALLTGTPMLVMDEGGSITNLAALRQQHEEQLRVAREKAEDEANPEAAANRHKPAVPTKRLVSYGTGSTPAAIAAAKAKKEKEEEEYFDKVLTKGKRNQELFLERKRVLAEAQQKAAAERTLAARNNNRNAQTKSGVAEWAGSFSKFFNNHVYSSSPHQLQIKDDPSSPRRKR